MRPKEKTASRVPSASSEGLHRQSWASPAGPGVPTGWGTEQRPGVLPAPGSPMPRPLSAQGLGAMGHILGEQLAEGCGGRKDLETAICLSPVSHSPTSSSNFPGRHQRATSPEPAWMDPASEEFLQSAWNPHLHPVPSSSPRLSLPPLTQQN